MKHSLKSKTKLLSIGKLKKKADRAVQDGERKKYPGRRCEIPGCPNLYEVIHHFIPKSLSNNLRYDPKNFLYICSPHHSKFHSFAEPSMNIIVYKLKGEEWFEYIQQNRHKVKRDNRAELLEIISKYN